jgi:exonuclease III
MLLASWNVNSIRARHERFRLGLQDGGDEMGARIISADIGGLRVINVYVVNGQVVGSDKYTGKLEWMRRLRAGTTGPTSRSCCAATGGPDVHRPPPSSGRSARGSSRPTTCPCWRRSGR